ncbi:hypothetical protein CY35_14G047400 [Sphagnum magellanicum]|nr:hypothetical protein CY35_14G047400 [Sphagnum magellanicum]
MLYLPYKSIFFSFHKCKVMCPTCLCTVMLLACEHDPLPNVNFCFKNVSICLSSLLQMCTDGYRINVLFFWSRSVIVWLLWRLFHIGGLIESICQRQPLLTTKGIKWWEKLAPFIERGFR